MNRRDLLAGGAAFTSIALATNSLAAESWADMWSRRLREDWPGWRRYAESNAAIIASSQPVDIVFMGDSITEGWQAQRPGFFKVGRICRGVSGETTPQMVLRMIPDVCDLKPRFVHIMAGTNDVAGNTGTMSLKNTQDCYAAMHAIAAGQSIHVIFASVPPASSFPWRPGVPTIAPINALNMWLRDFARKVGATFVDYHPTLSDGRGGMRPEYATDGVHPTNAGYDVMAKVLQPVLTRLSKSKPRSKFRKG